MYLQVKHRGSIYYYRQCSLCAVFTVIDCVIICSIYCYRQCSLYAVFTVIDSVHSIQYLLL